MSHIIDQTLITKCAFDRYYVRNVSDITTNPIHLSKLYANQMLIPLCIMNNVCGNSAIFDTSVQLQILTDEPDK